MDRLEIRDLSLIYPSVDGNSAIEALSSVNLIIEEGEFIVILGASGCGKTTLLNLLAGFIAPTKGKILLYNDNRIINADNEDEFSIKGPNYDRGVVFQKHALLPWLNVIDNVEFGLKLRGVSKSERYAVASKYLKLVGLEEFHNHKIYRLSGGMQQRVGIARALTSDPKILLMDEPLGALDALTRDHTQALILEIWKETKKIIFFITHNVEEALIMATKLIIMSPRPGRITHTFDLNFCHQFFKHKEIRHIKSMPDFIQMREKVLNLIFQDSES